MFYWLAGTLVQEDDFCQANIIDNDFDRYIITYLSLTAGLMTLWPFSRFILKSRKTIIKSFFDISGESPSPLQKQVIVYQPKNQRIPLRVFLKNTAPLQTSRGQTQVEEVSNVSRDTSSRRGRVDHVNVRPYACRSSSQQANRNEFAHVDIGNIPRNGHSSYSAQQKRESTYSDISGYSEDSF